MTLNADFHIPHLLKPFKHVVETKEKSNHLELLQKVCYEDKLGLKIHQLLSPRHFKSIDLCLCDVN